MERFLFDKVSYKIISWKYPSGEIWILFTQTKDSITVDILVILFASR